LQTLAGVTFDVRGLVLLDPVNGRGDFPKEVKGIPVGLKLRRLHFPQWRERGLHQAGTDGARVIIHYADGQSEKILLRLGEELGGMWYEKQSPAYRAKRGEVAWTGVNEISASYGATLELTKWTWRTRVLTWRCNASTSFPR
jgi:hypothetical protein